MKSTKIDDDKLIARGKVILLLSGSIIRIIGYQMEFSKDLALRWSTIKSDYDTIAYLTDEVSEGLYGNTAPVVTHYAVKTVKEYVDNPKLWAFHLGKVRDQARKRKISVNGIHSLLALLGILNRDFYDRLHNFNSY